MKLNLLLRLQFLIPKTMGAATTVVNKAAPVIPAPNVIVIKTLSTLLVILAILKYFLLNASRLVISSSKNFCTSDITFNLYECPPSSITSISTAGADGFSLSLGKVASLSFPFFIKIIIFYNKHDIKVLIHGCVRFD